MVGMEYLKQLKDVIPEEAYDKIWEELYALYDLAPDMELNTYVIGDPENCDSYNTVSLKKEIDIRRHTHFAILDVRNYVEQMIKEKHTIV